MNTLPDNSFRLDPSANSSVTSLKVIVELPPSRLVALFGSPDPGDNYQVSGHYTFTNDRGEVFTVYESRSTSLYWKNEGVKAPTPEEFWRSNDLEEMGIGGRTDATELTKWLVRQVGECRIAVYLDRVA